MRQRATAQTSIANRGRASLSAQVAALFASLGSTPKLWLDPSDPATRFQDQAGTTLVTADGQPYGRANDKSGAANNVGQATTTSRPLWKTDGALSWAQYDGADDSWQSLANLDLSSTDKVTVISGIRKLSDTGVGTVVGLNINSSTPQSFRLTVPSTSGAPNGIWVANGSSAVGAVAALPAAPASSVIVGYADIAAPVTGVRVNGIQTQSTTTLGAGNFGSSLLYIGRLGGSSAPFNGNLYGLMVIGRLLTADELSLCERYMAQKSGVTL